MYRLSFLLFFVIAGMWAAGQSYEQLNNKVKELYKEGKYAEAISVAIKAKDAAQKEFGTTSYKYSFSLANLALLYENTGDYAAAEPLYEQALAIDKKIFGEDHTYFAADLNNLAGIYQDMGKYAAAEPLYKQASAIFKKTSGEETIDYAQSLNNLAGLYESIGNYAAAEPMYRQALAIQKKVLGEEHPDFATALNNLANLYQHTGNFVDAEPLYKQALATTKKILGEEHPDYASSLNNLALLYKTMGNYSAAEPLYKDAITIYKKVLGEENAGYATSLSNLAGLYVIMGNYAAAEPLFKQAMAIIKKVLGEDHPYYAASLSNLALLYQNMVNYAAAEPLYKQALVIIKKVLGEAHPNYATGLSNLAALYISMNNFAAAEPLYKQALTIRKKALGEEHPDYAGNLNNLALLYETMGNYAAAEPVYKEALFIDKKVLGEEHPDYASILNNLAALYESMGNYAAAANYLMEGTKVAFNHIEKNFNNLSEAEKLKWWETSNGNFEAEPSLLFTNPNPPANFLQQACTQQLQLKGFVLSDGAKVLQEVRKNGNPQLQQLLNQWQSNKATLAKQYSLPVSKRVPTLDSLEKQTNEQEKQINQQSVVFRAGRENLQIGFKDVQRHLKNDEAAVEFIRFIYYHKGWTDSVLYAAFIILPNDPAPHFVTLCEGSQLARLLESKTNSSEQFVKQLYRGVTLSARQGDGKKGDSLYNLVWKPLLPWLKGIKKISFAPAGLLNRVAFNALPVDSSTYLIDKYQLRTYSSVRQLAEQKIPVSNTASANKAVLYGGIDFNTSGTATTSNNETAINILPDNVKRSIRGGSWNPLPGTLQEVNNINQLLKVNKRTARVITGTAATEESFKQLSGQSPAILHLATHGFSLPDPELKRKGDINNNDNQFTLADNPLQRSGIIMAGANKVWSGAVPVAGKEDGIVTAYEISNLDLSNTELVVLSACETALGDIKGTEGVFGLQRAFKLAGVQNMILSLWQVPDKETAELMALLYTNKLKGMTNYDAFNKAQDIMRKKYPPYYWAAFVLIE